MRMQGGQPRERESGQASVEFLAVLPAAFLILAIVSQLLLTGMAAWLVGNAARVAARAEAVGDDPEAAARSALPAQLREGLEVGRAAGGVRVRVRVPLLLTGGRSSLRIGGTAALDRARGG